MSSEAKFPRYPDETFASELISAAEAPTKRGPLLCHPHHLAAAHAHERHDEAVVVAVALHHDAKVGLYVSVGSANHGGERHPALQDVQVVLVRRDDCDVRVRGTAEDAADLLAFFRPSITGAWRGSGLLLTSRV